MYKLLALDMDGTTLNSNKKITPQVLEGINNLIDKGIYVVVASGRGLAEMIDYREEFLKMRYSILISGGLIFDYYEDKPVSIHPVTFEDSIKLIDIGLKNNAMIHLLTLREAIASPDDLKHMEDFNMGIYSEMFNKVCVRCDDLKAFAIEHKGEIVKVNLYHRSVESRSKTLEMLKDSKLQLVFAEVSNLEASPLGVTKAAGLIELCKYLNIDIAETVAIGDAPNDVEILKTAGYSVAMGNATDDIKELADFVTADNDHDGVLVAINKIFNNE